MLKTNEKKDDKVSSNESLFIKGALVEGKRIDGRNLLDYRDLSVSFSEDYGRLELSLGETKYVIISNSVYIGLHSMAEFWLLLLATLFLLLKISQQKVFISST